MYIIIIDSLDFIRGSKIYILENGKNVLEEIRVPKVEEDLPILLKKKIEQYENVEGILIKGPLKLSKNTTAYLEDKKIKIEFIK